MIPESYLMHYGIKGMKWGHSNSQYYIAVGTPADPELQTGAATRTVNPYTGNSSTKSKTSKTSSKSTSRDNMVNSVIEMLKKSGAPDEYREGYKNKFIKIIDRASSYDELMNEDMIKQLIKNKFIKESDIANLFSSETETDNSSTKTNNETVNNSPLSMQQSKINSEIVNNAKYRIEKVANFGTTLQTGFEDAVKLITKGSPLNASPNYASREVNRPNKIKKG